MKTGDYKAVGVVSQDDMEGYVRVKWHGGQPAPGTELYADTSQFSRQANDGSEARCPIHGDLGGENYCPRC